MGCTRIIRGLFAGALGIVVISCGDEGGGGTTTITTGSTAPSTDSTTVGSASTSSGGSGSASSGTTGAGTFTTAGTGSAGTDSAGTFTTGSSSGATSTGASSTGQEPCDGSGVCKTCTMCEQNRNCADLYSACLTDPACGMLMACTIACDEDDACKANCLSGSAGAFFYMPYAKCIYCDNCPSDCTPFDPSICG